MLDSLNDTGISAENDQYRGAFAVFARFDIIFRGNRWQNADGSNFVEQDLSPHTPLWRRWSDAALRWNFSRSR
jgi:hypothetical protein